jgi:C-terminal processing protease CtpA/Prc
VSRALVTEALKALRANYVFPDKAELAAAAITAELEAGAYDGLDEAELGARLTERLYELCADWHLRVRPRSESLHEITDPEQARSVWLEESRLNNYGVAKVERLDGNIGYLDLTEIAYPGVAGRAIAAAMELVSHTEALIVDPRRCKGGSPDGVIFWNSYLFADSNTHLNDIYDGASGETRQFWTVAYLPGERYLDRPVYVLTSARTFSGAEEFAYNLKAQRRATIVGETTRGGAHPTDSFPITPTFEITVPTARSVNPVTGTNWEGTGVEPDLAVPADEALTTAYRKALEHVAATATAATVRAEAHAALADDLYFTQ